MPRRLFERLVERALFANCLSLDCWSGVPSWGAPISGGKVAEACFNAAKQEITEHHEDEEKDFL